MQMWLFNLTLSLTELWLLSKFGCQMHTHRVASEIYKINVFMSMKKSSRNIKNIAIPQIT